MNHFSIASIMLPVAATSIISTWTPSPSIKKHKTTKTESTTPVSSSTTKTTVDDPVLVTKETIQPTATIAATSSATSTITVSSYTQGKRSIIKTRQELQSLRSGLH